LLWLNILSKHLTEVLLSSEGHAGGEGAVVGGARRSAPCGCTPAGPRRGGRRRRARGRGSSRGRLTGWWAEDEARRGDVAERGVGEEQRAGERERGGDGAGDDGGRVRAAEEEATAAAVTALVEAEDELVPRGGKRPWSGWRERAASKLEAGSVSPNYSWPSGPRPTGRPTARG
jgi:hypothetical protein